MTVKKVIIRGFDSAYQARRARHTDGTRLGTATTTDEIDEWFATNPSSAHPTVKAVRMFSEKGRRFKNAGTAKKYLAR